MKTETDSQKSPGNIAQRFCLPWSLRVIACFCLASLESTGGMLTNQPDVVIQDQADSIREKRITRDHGLPSNSINALLQTRDGYVWIATANGVVRYDGNSLRVFDRFTHREFASDNSTALAEDTFGVVWVGTSSGLISVNAGKVIRFGQADGLSHDHITALCATRSGDLWIGTERGMDRLSKGRIESVTVASPGGQYPESVYAICEDTDGNVWFSNILTIHRWRPGMAQPEPLSPFGPKLIMTWAGSIVQGHRNQVWFKGAFLFAFKAGGFAAMHDSHDFGTGRPVLSFDLAGRLWCAEGGGFLRCYKEGEITRVQVSSLAGDSVTSMLADRESNLWIGTVKGGLHRRQSRSPEALTMQSGLPDENVWALREDKSGGVWIGTDRGVSLWRDGRIALSLTNQLSDLRIRALHVDESGAVWIGTGGGLDRLDFPAARSSRGDEALASKSEIATDQSLVTSAATITRYRWDEDKPLNKVRVIKSDRVGNLWVGRSEGLMLYRDGQWQHFGTGDSLPTIDVCAIHEDRDGRLWIATYGEGVAVAKFEVRSSRFKVESVLSTTNGLPSNFAWALHEDSDGILWIGTERGLGRVDLSPLRSSRGGEALASQSQIKNRRSQIDQSLVTSAATVVGFTKAHGLFDEAINEIIEDDFGQLWLSSDRGIMRVDKRELNDVAAGRTNRVACVVYTESDGLPSSECNGQKSQPAGIKARDGRLWFPTTKGVAIIDPRKLDELDSRPPVLIEQIVVDGEKIFENLPGAQLSAIHSQLAPGRARAFEVHYTAPTFKAPEKVRFRHRLVGFDSDWVEAETRRVAYYTNLKPGRYRFEVLAANNHSLWSERAASFEFTLAPHYWQTWWFQPLCWSGALAAFGLVLWHLRRVHQERQRFALDQERSRIARDMHDELGSQLNRLGLALASHDTSDAASPPPASKLLMSAEETLDEIVWAMKPENDRLDRFVSHLREVASDHVMAAGLEFELDIPESIPAWPLRAEVRRNILLAVKEALTNALRHARARTVELRASIEERSFTIEIADDGVGLGASPDADSGARTSVVAGDGLRNMRERMIACGGQFELLNRADGTTVRFTIPRSL